MQRFLSDVIKTLRFGDVLICPKTGSRLRREETAGVTQEELNCLCKRNCSHASCRFGCVRSDREKWMYEAVIRYGSRDS